MSHEHRQHPERYYDDEGEAYEPDAVLIVSSSADPGAFDAFVAGLGPRHDDEGEAYEPDDLPVSEGHTWPYDFDTWYGPAR